LSQRQDKSAPINPRADKAAKRLEMARALEAQYLTDGSKIKGIEHLMIVAGASGAGKSTFVSQFITGELAAAARAQLPAGAENWMQLRVGGFDDWLPALLLRAKQEQIPGVILDYDMVGRGILDGCDYADDPILHMTKIAKTITVVNIRPSVEKIIGQLIKRENARVPRHVDARGHIRAAAYVLRQIRGVLARFMPTGWALRVKKAAEEAVPAGAAVRVRGFFDSADQLSQRPNPEKRRQRLRRKVSRYESSGWLEGIYKQWEDYLKSLERDGASIRQIFVEPDPARGEGFGWRLAEAPRPNSAANSGDAS
jgi:hypothetical protein